MRRLLRLTGEARFAEQLERVVLNQLFGAQRPDCAAWGYYVQMEGKKTLQRFPRWALLSFQWPARGFVGSVFLAVSSDAEGLVVNLYSAGQARVTLKDGTPVLLKLVTDYPSDTVVNLTVTPEKKKTFAVKLRIPSWCEKPSAKINGKEVSLTLQQDGYLKLDRAWSSGDRVTIELPMEAHVVMGDHLNQGKVAFLYGPLVLAADDALLADKGQRVSTIAIAEPATAVRSIKPALAPGAVQDLA
jgi:DUF1680 family protein